MDLLGLLGGSDLAGTDGPDGLVGNNNLSPLLLGELLGGSVELAGNDVDGLVGLALLYDWQMESGVSGGSSSWTWSRCPTSGSREAGRVTRVEMTYLQGLTNAENDGETAVDGGLDLAGDEL